MKYRLNRFVAILAVVLAGSLLAPAVASAATSTPASSATSAATSTAEAAQTKALATLKTKAASEIDRRIKALDKLNAAITAAPLLSAANKTALTTEVTNTKNDLTALKTKIAADTDLATATTDAATIVTSYRVYALVVPQVYLVRTADDQQAVEAKLTTVAAKLQTRLTDAKAKGKDVTALQAKLTDMNTQIATAKGISASVQTKVLALKPTDYNADHTILVGYRDQLKTAHTANVAAVADAKAIVTGLAAL